MGDGRVEIKVSQPTISYQLNAKRVQKTLQSSNTGEERFALRDGIWTDVEKHLYEWKLHFESRLEISGDQIKTQAALFYKRLHPDGDANKFKLEGWSDGWLSNYKKRFGLRSYRRHGEAASVDEAALEAALAELRRQVAE